MCVHIHLDAWCIITICGVSAVTVETQDILQRGRGFLRDCLRGTEAFMSNTPKLSRLV